MAAGLALIVLLKEGRGGKRAAGMEQSSSAAWECWDRELPGSVHTWTVIRALTLCWERCGGAG